jgi:predicted ATPase
MSTYREACVRAINRFDGYVAQYLGDGLLAYFSYPAAHEDDAERAVRAGLGAIEELQALNHRNRQTGSVEMQVRVGIHTGLVVVGDIPGIPRRDSTTVVGETPNIAARIQQIAPPGTVVISSATHRLVHGLFIAQDLGAEAFKGVSAPVHVYRVLGEGEAHGRFEIATNGTLTQFVGRDTEMASLIDLWERAKTGSGRIVLLSGEPGIGKSRLVRELREHVVRERAQRIEIHCSPYHRNSALYPVVRHVQRFVNFGKEDLAEERLEKVRAVFRRFKYSEPDTVPLIASLLSLPMPDDDALASISPQKQKQRLFEVLCASVVESAEASPTYIAWEDLQWADPSSLELIDLLLERVRKAPILLVLTFRSEFVPPWDMGDQSTSIVLTRLGESHVSAMISGIASQKILPLDVLKQIVSKTDGVPLFVEELTKMVLESRFLRAGDDRYFLDGPLPSLAIPATLQDSLMARLDRMAPLKEIAQLAAVLGREFSYELIRAISPLDEEKLQAGLAELASAELLYQRGSPPDASYLFKHALVQDTAYQSLLKSKRLQHHVEVAGAIEQHFSHIAENHPELVAHHYAEAGMARSAIPYWQSAGRVAAQRSANVEAIRHFSAAIGLIRTLPDSAERDQSELAALTALGSILIASRGWASPETGSAYNRAQELCRRLGETPELSQALYGISTFHLLRGEQQMAHELARELLDYAERQQDSPVQVAANFVVGLSLYHLGDTASSKTYLERGLTLYDPSEHRLSPGVFGQDLKVSCLCYDALALWDLGYPDQALARCREGLGLARKIAHPFSLVWALGNAVLFHFLRREWADAGSLIEEGLALAIEQEIPFFTAYLTLCRGSILAGEAQSELGIAQIHEGLAAYQALGTAAYLPHFLAILAEACARAGRIEEGLAAVTRALEIVDANGDEIWRSDLSRLHGELLLLNDMDAPSPKDFAGAQGRLLEALESARRRGAKSYELRAAISLARMSQRTGETNKACDLLAGVYGWFTEGFETPDLREAAALIQELSDSAQTSDALQA